MKAAVAYEANASLRIEDVEIARPGSREVLVKLMASGVCHSDWHILKGEWGNALFPAILGHEGAGVVEAVGDEVTRLKIGDHVILVVAHQLRHLRDVPARLSGPVPRPTCVAQPTQARWERIPCSAPPPVSAPSLAMRWCPRSPRC